MAIFDANDVLDLGQANRGLVGQIGHRAARHVVQNVGHVDGLGHRFEMLIQAFLRGLL